MSIVYIDGKAFEVDPQKNMLQVSLELGFHLEYFCWHPALGSVGACRQCAVKQFRDEKDEQGRIAMSCMTPATNGTRISIEDPEAVEFRAAVIEGLMLNHPHDCPVCDEGGECHLQDMTVMSGHNYRAYDFQKRTFENQYLGPLIHHEMNRCIQCYRCVRYYRDYAGGDDLNSFVLRDRVFFGRHEDGILENEFAGNLVEVCPTGVFTDKTLKRHYTRKWDLQMAPSVCVQCGLGCNVTAGERYGSLRRIVNRYNRDVNGYFLCDRGRFGYEFVNSERRIRQPLLLRNGSAQAVEKTKALEHAAGILSASQGVIGIGSPRASLESNFALRALVGADRFHAGIADDELRLLSLILKIAREAPVRPASLHEAEHSDAVLVLGEDVTNTAPRMALSLRQSVRQKTMQIAEDVNIPLFLDRAVREAVQDQKGPLFLATPHATALDDAATRVYRGAPEDLARLGFAVAHSLDDSAPAVAGLGQEEELAQSIAQALREAERPLVVTGAACRSETVLQAAANVVRALSRRNDKTRIAFAVPEANSLGLALLEPRALGEAFETVQKGEADAVVIAENDLYRRAPAADVDAFLGAAKHVIALDCLANPTTEKAEALFPAASFAEGSGTLVNNEGRAQRFFEVFSAQNGIQESWLWLQQIMTAAGREAPWQHLDDVVDEMSKAVPALAEVARAAGDSKSRLAGAKVARQPHRYSGRTAMRANIDVHEPKPPDDPDSALSFSMEGASNKPAGSLTPFFWSPGWNSIQAANNYQSEIMGPLKGGDTGVHLLEPAEGNGAYFEQVPEAFAARSEEWLFLPRHHIFGSEESSLAAPAIAELAPKPYVALHPLDANSLQVEEEEEVEVTLPGRDTTYRAAVKISPDLRKGTAALPAGLPDLQGISLPAWGRIARPS